MERISMLNYTPVFGTFEAKGDIVVFKGSQEMEQKDMPIFGIILFPKRIKDGKIKATVKFEEAHSGSLCGIIFDYIPLDTVQGFPCQYAGISNQDGYICYSFSETKRFSFGKQRLIESGKEYELLVSVSGNFLSLYVNDVLVGNCMINKPTETNIGLYFHNTKSVEILDFEVESQKPKAFVVMQFSDDYKAIYEDVIKTVCTEKGFNVIRGDESYDNGMIVSDIMRKIEESSVIIADITPDNPNVFYEVGYAHALRKPTILMSDKSRDRLPFDVSGFRTIFYDNKIGGKNSVEKMLGDFLDNIVLGK